MNTENLKWVRNAPSGKRGKMRKDLVYHFLWLSCLVFLGGFSLKEVEVGDSDKGRLLERMAVL